MSEISYIDRHDTDGIQFGLKKIYGLLSGMGNPHEKLKVIHIAGTNGKGSVGLLLANILSLQGYKVGRLSSPTVFSETEFAQVYQYNSKFGYNICKEIDKQQLDIYEEKYGYLLENITPSGFEVQVAYSCKFFLEAKCDIVIVETGLGGQLDATNIFKHTLCDIITSISMDHMNMLGNSIEVIANCKCGIITKNGYVVTTSSNKKILDIIRDYAKENNSKLVVVDIDEITNVRLEFDKNTFNYKGYEYGLKLNGRHQIENALIAIEAVEVLRHQGYIIKNDNILIGLKNTRNKGRLDMVSEHPIMIADGAHNIAGIQCLIEALEDYFPERKCIFLVSIFRDKEYTQMIKLIATKAEKIVFFDNTNKRSVDSETMCKVAERYMCRVSRAPSIKNAIIELCNDKNEDRIIVCAGSLSFMKDVYDLI